MFLNGKEGPEISFIYYQLSRGFPQLTSQYSILTGTRLQFHNIKKEMAHISLKHCISLLTFYTLFLSTIFSRVLSDSTFNFEINSRVQENIQAFLLKISEASTLPLLVTQSGIVNITDFYTSGFLPGSRLFFNMKQLYRKEVSIFQVGFENRVYYAAVNNNPYPFGIEVDANNASSNQLVFVYYPKQNGLPLSLANCSANVNNCPFPFDCRKRPWYMQGKAARTKIWTKPFLQVQPTTPTVSLVNPIFVPSSSGQRTFIGNFAANVGLLQISSFLQSSYMGTNKNVFVVDKLSGYLIGSSLNALLSTADNVRKIV